MLRHLSRRKEYILDKLVWYSIISEEDKELYLFGLECLLLKTLHCISYFCIGAYLKMLPELFMIGCVLIPLRRNAGGYHAKTKLGCYLFSCMYIAMILLLSKITMNQFTWWITLWISNLIIFFMSPVDNPNRKLDEEELIFFRKKSQLILLLANAGYIFFTIVKLYDVGVCLSCGICASAFLLVLGRYSNKRNVID
jgi:accessory gene regulator B